jgi:hypothetical protein
MLRQVVRLGAGLICALALAAPAHAGGPSMLVGAVDDAAQQPTLTAAKSQMSLARLAGFNSVRLSAMWIRGQTAMPSAQLTALQNAVSAATFSGMRPLVAIYPIGSSSTPTTDADRAAFATYAVSLVKALPGANDFIIGNEPNLNLFWLPQFAPDGSDAAAPGYEALLATTYDAIKQARPGAHVIGGTSSPHGQDCATCARKTHSPTAFIRDLGAAYRASGRTAPIMDAFDIHVYQDSSAIPPSFLHPTTTTISVPDYGKLVTLLGQAFDGTGQPGSTLPILYGEFGVQTAIPTSKAVLYSGTESVATVDEATQAAYYREAMKIAYCQPNVAGLMLFLVSDEPRLEDWQSGVRYADGSAKSSLASVKSAISALHAGTLTKCPDATAPKVTLTTPAQDASLPAAVDFSVKASDDVGVGNVEFLVNGAPVGSKSVPPYTFTWSSRGAGEYTFSARAYDAMSNVGNAATVTAVVQGVAPDTTITSSPPDPSGDTSATFTFKGSASNFSFQCSLDGAARTPCASPVSYTGLALGQHTFTVRAVGPGGNADPTPASYTWKIADTTPPETTITSGPSGSTASRDAAFSFTSSEPGTFECSLDSAAFATCTSPAAYHSLADGPHTFAVRATDAAGNVDATPATQSWTVAFPAPANDAFAAAQAVSTGAATGTTDGATKEPGEPNHAGNSGGHSVWFRGTAPTTGFVTFTTQGSAFDTLLAVYTGSSVNQLTLVGSNDDAPGVKSSTVRVPVTKGVTYSIAIDGHNGASGAYTFSWAYS